MAESLFEIIEHVIPCQNVREYPNALRDQNAVLRLAIKEYKPRKEYSQDGGEPGVTIVATHANGFPKVHMHPTLSHAFWIILLL